jgi:hypothetical protein
MAIPNWDALNVQLSREIGDAVAAASTSGVVWSDDQRDDFLNEAVRRLLRKWIAVGNNSALRGYIATEAQSLTSSQKLLSGWTGGVDTILAAYNDTDSQVVYPADVALREEVQTGNNPYLLATTSQQRYTVNNGYLYLHGGTATSSVRLTYVKPHTALSNGVGSTDIAIPSQYWPMIIDMAIAVAMESDPSENVNLTRATIKAQAVEKEIGT